MADSATFEWACKQIETQTSLGTLQARGAMRLAIKRAGLAPDMLTPAQLRAIASRVMPAELQRYGIPDSDRVASALASCPDSLTAASQAAEPDAFFRRVGGSNA